MAAFGISKGWFRQLQQHRILPALQRSARILLLI
jgi:hypothetical protein